MNNTNQGSSTNEVINHNNNNSIDTDNLNDQKHHRRSKHEQEGRNSICAYCSKGYLSKPALNNHLSTKHSNILSKMNLPKRNRGRPRKTRSMHNSEVIKSKFANFFEKDQRCKMPDETVDLIQVAQTVIADLYAKYPNVMFKQITSYEEHAILSGIINFNDNDKKPLVICDDILCLYLRTFFLSTNQAYFTFLVKFVVLFRECVNLSQREIAEKYALKEFTSIDNAETLPNHCNEFFAYFLDKYNFFEFVEEERNELIEITQHFCFWLYWGNYTQSKLSLAE